MVREVDSVVGRRSAAMWNYTAAISCVVSGRSGGQPPEGLGAAYPQASEAEVELAKGSQTPQVCRKLGISEQTYYRGSRQGLRT